MAPTVSLTCPECGFELSHVFLETPDFQGCKVCGTELSVRAFPACFQAPETIQPADLFRGEEETSCFHHADKKAVDACSRCGKFLCALCSVEIGTELLCPECLIAGETKGADQSLERERTLYDSIAFAVAVITGITISLSILGAPAALYLVFRYWKRPSSIVRRWQWRKYAALIIALSEVGFWIFIFLSMFQQGRRGTTL